MKKIILSICLLTMLFSCGSNEPNPCLIAEDFIKTDLNYPKEASMSVFDCSKETNSDGSYTILTKISAKNSFGIEKEFIYKVTLSYNGGITTDIGNWTLIKMQSEEYK